MTSERKGRTKRSGGRRTRLVEKELRAEEDSEEGAARRRGGGDKAINCGNIRRIVLSLPLSSSLACSLALCGCAGRGRLDLWTAFFLASPWPWPHYDGLGVVVVVFHHYKFPIFRWLFGSLLLVLGMEAAVFLDDVVLADTPSPPPDPPPPPPSPPWPLS